MLIQLITNEFTMEYDEFQVFTIYFEKTHNRSTPSVYNHCDMAFLQCNVYIQTNRGIVVI